MMAFFTELFSRPARRTIRKNRIAARIGCPFMPFGLPDARPADFPRIARALR